MLVCRLLDDNRELYVPELGEMVKPHPHFMLFATQNPAGAYGGRKVPYLPSLCISRMGCLKLESSFLPCPDDHITWT